MRILFLSAEYPPETGWGGIGSYVKCIASGLVGRGHEVHVLSCAPAQQHRDYADRAVHVHRRRLFKVRGAYRVRLPLTLHRLAAGISTFTWARRLGVPFDVVEYPEWNGEGWLFALLRRTPTVAHLHTPLSVMIRHCGDATTMDIQLASYIERFSVLRADNVTSPSNLLADEVAAEGWNVEEGIRVVPYPVDWQTWAEIPPASQAPPVVQFVGRIEPRKAPEVLVHAMTILRHEIPEAAARFAGKYLPDSSGVFPAMPWSDEKNFEGCSFVGQMPRVELGASLTACRVVAQPSLFENFSLAALESMAAGRAVVVTSTAGIAPFVTANRCGEVVPPRDAAALAQALKPYLSDPQYAAQTGGRARDAVRRELTPGRIAALREKVYASAVDSFREPTQ